MIAEHKGEIPFIILLLPFVAGIAAGLYLWPGANTTLLLLLFLIFIAAFIVLNRNYQRLKIYARQQWLGGLLLHSILFTGGWFATLQHNELAARNHFAKYKADYLLVQISNEPQSGGKYIRLTALAKQAVRQQKSTVVSGSLMVIAPLTPATAKLSYGDLLLVNADYTPVNPPYNPAEFNYKQYLAFQNIHYQLFIDPGKLKTVQRNTGNAAIAYSLRLRKQLVDELKAGIKDTGAAAVASTLMLGYKADLSTEVLQAYSKTGTIHVLSVSGAHVAIIYAFIVLCLGFLNQYRYGRLVNALISILLIWGYSLLTGFSPAVCRAALMITFFIAGRTYYRHINSLNLLAASAFILLLVDPYLLADVGFQLSYLAVFGLLAFQPVIYKQLRVKNKWLNKLWYLCSASVAAQLITFPLSIYYFHQFPYYFLISNLLIIIPTEIIMAAGGLYLLLAQVPYLNLLLSKILEYCILSMTKSLAFIEHLPYAYAGGLWITMFENTLLLLSAVLLLFILHQHKAAHFVVITACVLTLAISAGFKAYTATITDSITFFNLRKHSGILFKSGRKSVLLTDLNPTDKPFAYSLQPCLDSNRITENSVVNFNQNTQTAFFAKRDHYLQFIGRRLLIVDQYFYNRPLQHPVTIDYLFITGSPATDLNLLSKNYVYHAVVLDANNSNQAIERFTAQAARQQVHLICLKRNKSFTVTSN